MRHAHSCKRRSSLSGGVGFYRLMLLMTQEDTMLRQICPQCDEDPKEIMGFLQGLPEEKRRAFLRRNERYFGEKGGPLKRLGRAVQRGMQDGFEGIFHRLADEWQVETAMDSYRGTIPRHPAYRQIVLLGMPAVSLIFQELLIDSDDGWLFILEEIIGEDSPVIPEELQEKPQPKIDIWLEWGRSRGFVE